MSRTKKVKPVEILKKERATVPFPNISYDKPDELIANLPNAWVISDTHFFHLRLWEVLRPTAEGGRNPKNTELILTNWRKIVQPEDIVLHLGDVALGINPDTIAKSIGWLPGQVWLIPGNHDRSLPKLTAYRELGWKIIKPFSASWNRWQIKYTHEPVAVEKLSPTALNVHGHIHHNQAPSERHLNCCIEQLGYAPVKLQPLLENRFRDLPIPLPKPGHWAQKNNKTIFVPIKSNPNTL